jgi:hypothetical protein
MSADTAESPLPDPEVLHRRMLRLEAQASVAVHDQHLVSKVLLGLFAEPIGQRGAPQAFSLNLEHPAPGRKAMGSTCAGRRRSRTS